MESRTRHLLFVPSAAKLLYGEDIRKVLDQWRVTNSDVFCVNCGVVLGSVVGRGCMLQGGRSRVRFSLRSLHFSIDGILATAI
jgi:hypothetical protein